MVMDMTVAGIGAVVVAELREAGYMESTVGQYLKTIKVLTEFVGTRGVLARVGRAVRVDDGQCADGTVQPAAQVRLQASCWCVRLVCAYRTGGPVGTWARWRGPASGAGASLGCTRLGKRRWAVASGAGHPRGLREGGSQLSDVPGTTRDRRLDGADGASVLAFLESLLGRWAKSSLFWVVSNFRPFLTFTGRTDLVDAAEPGRRQAFSRDPACLER